MQRRPKDFEQPQRFLWTDRPDAADTAARLGSQLRTSPERLLSWSAEGYAILDKAVSTAAIDHFLPDSQAAITDPAGTIMMTYWDETGHHREKAGPDRLGKTEAKVLDLHVYLDSTHDLIFAPDIVDFLTDVFQDDAVAFQSLYFEYGSQQGCHQDTAFVYVEPPLHFAASWIALEDIVPGSGELFYFPGSQKLDDLLFADGTKALRGGDPDAEHYSSELERIAAEAGLTKQFLHIPKGDALIWAADLMHGGAPIHVRHTRRSLVTHYCPKNAAVPYVVQSGKALRQVRDRGWVVGQNVLL
jgi:hypothetical protein